MRRAVTILLPLQRIRIDWPTSATNDQSGLWADNWGRHAGGGGQADHRHSLNEVRGPCATGEARRLAEHGDMSQSYQEIFDTQLALLWPGCQDGAGEEASGGVLQRGRGPSGVSVGAPGVWPAPDGPVPHLKTGGRHSRQLARLFCFLSFHCNISFILFGPNCNVFKRLNKGCVRLT